MPARAAAKEAWISPQPRGGGLKVAVAYPNSYRVGMSNLGYQAVLGAFLEDERFDARRVFWEGQKAEFPDGGQTLGDFDAVALSVSYQPDMVHLPRLLETVRARRSGRSAGPLLIAGGVAVTINPETVSDLFDLIVLGDAEPVLPLLMDGLASGEDPSSLFDRLVEVPGIYIPSRFGHYHSKDSPYQLPSALQDRPGMVTPSVLPDLSARPARPAVITDGSEFGRLYLLEVSRGCPAGCLFCAAGTACGPVRFLGMEAFVAEAERGLKYRKTIGLVGTAVSYHPHLESMAGFLLDRGGSFSPSSIRAEKVTPRLAELLVRAKHKTVSLAPEAGTRSLRASIGKDLTDEQFLTRADILLQAGIPNLKLYFMVGLPGETNSDITGIVELVMKLKDRMMHWGKPRGRVGSVTVSVNPFVPKPRTALERAPVATETVLKERMRRIRAKLGSAGNILVQTGSVRRAYLDALLSLGDRTVADVLDKLPAAGVSLKRLIKIYPAAEQVLFGRESGELPWHFIK